VLEILYHHAKFGWARISPAAVATKNVEFLQRAALQALYNLRQFRPSVRPSVRPSHAGIVSKRRHVAWCSLHCQMAKCV